MKELIIDKKAINLYPRLTTKKTSSGIVLVHNPNELLKISRKYTCLLGLEKEEDIPDYIKRYLESLNLQKEKFIELEKRSKNIKNTNFPLGIVKYNDLLVGTILHYIKNSCDIDTFLKSNPNEFYNVFVKLLDNIYELFNEYIYPTDIYSNVLIDKNNNPKLIDLDDNWLLLRDKKDIALEKIVLENYKIFIKDFANYFNFLRKIRIELDEVNTNYDDLVYSLKRIDLIRKNSI